MANSKIIAVIGDIHGCCNALKALYGKIEGRADDIYAVGDLTDRGLYSREAVEFCIANDIKPVRGNHEDIILRVVGAIEDKPNIVFEKRVKNYILNGGGTTIKSYTGSDSIDTKAFRRALEESGHLDYIIGFPFKYEFDTFILTHAGISDASDEVIWHREVPSNLNKFQVFGHTPLAKYDYRPGWYANIDTGCVYKNHGRGNLTAILIDDSSGEVVEFISEPNQNDTL